VVPANQGEDGPSVGTETPAHVDLDAYCRRTGYTGDRLPTRAALEGLHLAHATHIPFENLDVLLGRPIRLDPEGLQAKLVQGRRGGYCFEQNTLFGQVLEQLGFQVTRLAARVRFGATRLLPRTHMLLRVDVEGSPWLADVGFGGEGLLHPVPLEAGRMVQQYAWTYRVLEESGFWVLQSRREEGWLDLYAFTEEPQLPVDYEVASYYTATHPDSIFRRMLTAQRPTPEARYILRNYELTLDRGTAVEKLPVADDDELLRVLAECFGLEMPRGTRFPLVV
jgi:N-hydroxyarylamine O-acetyltransferase